MGIETDTDDWTWIALLRDAAAALSLPEAKPRLEAAQWQDERLREALPLYWIWLSSARMPLSRLFFYALCYLIWPGTTPKSEAQLGPTHNCTVK